VLVAGDETPIDALIELAGAKNAISGFSGYKPLTPEALVEANPDILLLFDEGLQSLNGMEGLLSIRGISETKAGRKKHIIQMDSYLLNGFGPQLGTAMGELRRHIEDLN
jgi:iron complex transport system substrate-binding protein